MRRLIVLSGTVALLATTTGCPGPDAPPPADQTATIDTVIPADTVPATQPSPDEPVAVAPPAEDPEPVTPPPGTQPAPAPAPTPPPATPPATPPAAGPGLPPGVTTAMIQEGQQLYGTVCTACHGAAGTGTPIGPALNDQDWIHINGEFEEIVNITVTGIMQPQRYQVPMPPRGGGPFTDDQIRAISAYVYHLSRGG